MLRQDYPLPVPAPGEALIKVRKAGICNTDLELVRGYKRFSGILGHEFVGVVEKHPDSGWIGRRVVGEINVTCGHCVHCRSGRANHCLERQVLGISRRNGAFAEYLTLPAANLLTVPDTVPDEVAVFAEPVAAALEILQQVHIRPGDHVVVLGDGKLGLLCAQVIHGVSCHTVLVGRHRHKLDIASQAGIAVCQLGLDKTIPSYLVGADVVVDCTGNPQGLAYALQLVRPCGSIVLKSTYEELTPADMTSVVVRELHLLGSRCGPLAPALHMLANDRLQVKPLIDGVYPLSHGLEALQKAGTKETLKVLIDLESTA